MSAASRLARRSKTAQIYVAERGFDVSYGACGLPYYIGGFNDEINLMRIRGPEEFIAQGIDLNTGVSAEGIDFEAKEVKLFDINSKRGFSEKYDKLLIAAGSDPIKPVIPGIDLPGVCTLKTLEDGRAIKDRMAGRNVKDVLIVGGGYIGLELSEACLKMGKSVRVIESKPGLLNTFDPEFGLAARMELESHGVSVHTFEAVGSIEANESRLCAVCNGNAYEADLIILAVGTKPNTGFVRNEAIIKLPNGAIVTDSRMETSVPGVYAAGDCAASTHKILRTPTYIPLGTNANKQGRTAADVMLGKDASYDNALGTAMLRCVTLELAKTGVTKSEAAAAGIEADTVSVTANSHAPYYPAPVPVTLKLCYRKDNKVIIGAQIMGRGEAAWRINILACAVDRGMTNKELGQLDLGYAPPFSSVWDAVHIAANAIQTKT